MKGISNKIQIAKQYKINHWLKKGEWGAHSGFPT